MPHRTVTGPSDERHSKHAKTHPPNNKHHQSKAHIHHIEEGPPHKKRRTDASPKSVLEKALVNGTRPPVKISFIKPRSIQQAVNDSQQAVPGKQEEDTKDDVRTVYREFAEAELSGKKGDKRILRSQDPGAHGSSQLPEFFADYWTVINGPDEEPDVLNVDTIFYLDDDNPKTNGPSIASPKSLPFRSPKSRHASGSTSPSQPRKKAHRARVPATVGLPTFQTLDLSQFEAEALQFNKDPLDDDEYLAAHRRGERAEKQERNKQREKSQHEKPLLEKLKAELAGPEWHKTMGLSGMPDTELKRYEGKRSLYYRKVKEMLVKFDDWKEKEKRMRQRKDRAAARAAREADSDDDADEEEETDADADTEQSQNSSIDASALQLQQEAGLRTKTPLKIRLRMPAAQVQEQHCSGPFTSFFAKSHERAGALARHRRGRHVLAFGQPLPDMPDSVDFDLPEADFQHEKQQHRKSTRRR